MNDLNKKAFGGLLGLFIVLASLLFVSAGTLDYWQAWIFLAVFFSITLAVTLYLMKNDPNLLEKRVEAGPSAEKEGGQKIIQSLASLSFVALFIVSALDHRFGWSAVPSYVVAAGDVLVAAGLIAVFFVFKENTYASAIIEVGEEQKLISTGLYGVVRHPMYAGAMVMLAGVPISLGSWWGLIMVVPMASVIIVRLLEEEKFLIINLSGYPEYQKKVRYRLLPHIW